MEYFKLDDRVKVIGKNAKGKIAFIGKIHLSEGIMYGIALDKPKGRCNGQIGDVRYFKCPKDHGVFVRACQLEMDDGNSSDDSEDYYRDVIPRPTYPNYLKFSSKMNFRKSKYHSKSKEHVSKVTSPLKQDVRNKKPSDDNQYLESTSSKKVSKDPKPKVKEKRHLSRKREEKRTADDENFLTEKILAEKINTQTQQIDTIRRYLKKLKTYVRWSRRFDLKESEMKDILNTAIDSVIRNMVEIVGNSDIRNDHDKHRGDIGLEKENDLLLMCIWDLEKKNETLVECMTKVRGLLLNSWKLRSRGKFKNDVHKKENSERPCPAENKYKNCSPKNPETQLESKFLSKNQQHLDEFFQNGDQEERETETIKRYLESLNFGAKNKNQEASSSSLHLRKENGLNDHSKGDAQHVSKGVWVRNYFESITNDIKEFNKELSSMCGEKSNEKCDERVTSKSNLIYENTKSPISKESQMISPTNDKAQRSPNNNSKTKHKNKREKTNIRSQSGYVSDKRLKWEQNASDKNTDNSEDDKDPTKELSELISNIMTNITLDEKTEMSPKDSSKSREQNKNHSATYAVAGKSCSNPDSDKFGKVSNSSNKSKSEDNLKTLKSVRDGKSDRSTSPKQIMHLKQTIEVRKQPRPRRSDRKD